MKKVIYENDMPCEESSLLYDIFGSFRMPHNMNPKFKPNGVSDNRQEYYHKRFMHNHLKQLEEIWFIGFDEAREDKNFTCIGITAQIDSNE